ncbi:hypothetical protein OUZ56_001457 [Daphnia magna]|uniref:Uncharacterized protein n=1 Tax=Daphnia magna TaxID=35525 RepID=A0ABR0A2R4_9CRUS|nr:hypothetical protein OUZ56_001457 [Daphnia magna]
MVVQCVGTTHQATSSAGFQQMDTAWAHSAAGCCFVRASPYRRRLPVFPPEKKTRPFGDDLKPLYGSRI